MTLNEIEYFESKAREARSALFKPNGFMPPKLWHKLERARSAVDLLMMEVHAVKAEYTAKALEGLEK